MDAPALTATAPGAVAPTLTTDASTPKSGNTKMIIVGILILIIIIVLVYLGYQYYTEKGNPFSGKKEGFVEGQRQERSDTGGDFDLQQSIKQLEIMQNKVLSDLSNVH